MTPNIKDVSIDGPYGKLIIFFVFNYVYLFLNLNQLGTCAEDVSKYEHLILIGAGIGIVKCIKKININKYSNLNILIRCNSVCKYSKKCKLQTKSR